MTWSAATSPFLAPVFEVYNHQLRVLHRGEKKPIIPISPELIFSVFSSSLAFPLFAGMTTTEVDNLDTVPEIVKAIQAVFLAPDNLVPND